MPKPLFVHVTSFWELTLFFWRVIPSNFSTITIQDEPPSGKYQSLLQTIILRLLGINCPVLNLQMPVAAAPVGTSYCWPFPVPWKTVAKGDVFTIQPSVATMGTWAFIINGFASSI